MNALRGTVRLLPLFVLPVLLPLLPGCPEATAPGSAVSGATFEIAGQRFAVEVVAEGLEVPWALGFAPDASVMFVTERPGRLLALDPDSGAVLARLEIENVAPTPPRSEQGLMGLAVSPNFESDRMIYVSYTMPIGAPDFVKNVIDRFRFTGDAFERVDPDVLVDKLPASFIHDGLPLGFGPDGMLYASTGDATESNRAQDVNALNGKYLRMTPEGAVPTDNPVPDSLVYSLGHRNSQGFDWHPADPTILLGTEHGPSFPLDGAGGQDEINRIVAGANYGWPLVRGDQTGDGFKPPLYQTGDDTIAPGGGSFSTGVRYPAWANAFLFAGLADTSLWVLQLDPDDPDQVATIDSGMTGAFGRLRAVIEGPDGYLYVSTSNRDTRGTPREGDDRILRLIPIAGDT
jgi:aldose sugar dehydrogenase